MHKKESLIKQIEKELENMKGSSLYPFAEDIYHTLILTEFSEKELDFLLAKEILYILASNAQEDDAYHDLIDNTIKNYFKG